MFSFQNFGARVKALEGFIYLGMSKTNDKVYYAVGRGRQLGIYNTWAECKSQIDGISNAKFRKFYSLGEAEEFINFWRNYESPTKESNETKNVVSRVSKEREFIIKEGTGNKMRSEDRPVKKTPLILGKNNEKNKDSDDKAGVSFTDYVSPLPSGIRPQFRSFKKRSLLNGGTDRRQKNSQIVQPLTKSSPDQIQTSSASFKFVSPTSSSQPMFSSSNETSQCSTRSIFPQCDPSPSETKCSEIQTFQVTFNDNKKIVKEEVIEVDDETENAEDMTEVSERLSSFLESALNVITKQTKPERLRSWLKLSVKRLIAGTNPPVTPQMEPVMNETRSSDGEGVEASRPTTPPQTTVAYLTPPSPQATSTDQKNVEVLALNLRLDSFEKRFDACLKEVGAIAAEISHIKSEIKEMKENMDLGKTTPRKNKSGMFQTTLSFGASPSCSSPQKDADSEEPPVKRGRTLKRKTKRSSPSVSGEEDEDQSIVSRIKTEAVDYTSFTVDSNEFVEVYTDGACSMNGKSAAKAGIGIWFGDSHPLNVSAPVEGNATNNSAEIQAARVAVELAIKAGISKLKILTDSEFLINCATKWMRRWKSNGWKLVDGGPVKNRKELEKLDKAASKITVRWEKVEAHSGIKGNEMADRLAVQGASKYSR